MLVLLFTRHELRYDHFHENEGDVHRVLRDKRGNLWPTIPFPSYEDASATEQRRLPRALTEQLPSVKAATNFYVRPFVFLEAGDGALLVSLAAASYQAWTTARIHPADALRQE